MEASKVKFAGIAIAVVAAAGATGFLALGAFNAAKALDGEAAGAAAQIERLRSAEIYPSDSNIALLKEENDKLDLIRESLSRELEKYNVKSSGINVTPSSFVQTLGQFVSLYRAKAPSVGARKPVGEDFAFGFDAYVGANPAMPSDEEVAPLAEQLLIVKKIADVLYESNVSRIEKIVREPVDEATRRIAPKDGARPRPQPEPEQRPSDSRKRARPGKSEKAPPPPFSSQCVELAFTATQDSLVKVVNRLSSMNGLFVVIRDFSAGKSSSDLKLPSGEFANLAIPDAPSQDRRLPRQRTLRQRSVQTEEKTAATAVDANSVSALPPEGRVISGPDIDPPLQVRMKAEIFSFGKEGR